jgi:hypothetical protein
MLSLDKSIYSAPGTLDRIEGLVVVQSRIMRGYEMAMQIDEIEITALEDCL